MVTIAKERKENGQDSYNLILSVALELFTRQGYDGTSIDDIRHAAGFKSKASLYTHFRSKEEVANALLEKWQGEQGKVLLEAYQQAKDEPLSRFVQVGRAFIEWGLSHPQEYAFCFLRVQQEKLMKGEYGYLGEQPDPIYSLMRDLLRQLREKYSVRKIADAALLSMIVGMVSKATIDQEAFGSISLQERCDQLIEMCLGVVFTEHVALENI